jgi:phosphoribosylformylglycinamidine cyclo-ligase
MKTQLKKIQSVYAADGVNVDDEADFSSFAGTVCKASYKNSRFVKVHDLSEGSFRGPRPFTLQKLPKGSYIELSSDGIGTKGVLIDAAGAHEGAGYDLIAMVSSDITRYGGVPLVLANILDVASVGEPGSNVSNTYKRLMKGLSDAAREIGVVILKGETAQMGVCLGSEIPDSPTRFNWGAVMTGAYHPKKMITGNTLKEGQAIVALKECGFRSNGISSVRAAFRAKYGEKWWTKKEAQQYMKAAAAPCVLYDTFVNTLHGWYAKDFKAEVKLHGVIHLSGGGIKEKLGRDQLFRRGLSAEINNLFMPPEIMQLCKEWRGMSDGEFYTAWNGGQGMLLVVNEKDAEYVCKRAAQFGIEAQIAGKITKGTGSQISIRTPWGTGVTYKNSI